MKIACISYYLPPVDLIGSGMQMHGLANAYVRHGHQVTMFSPYAKGADDALYQLCPVPVGNRNRVIRFAWNLRKQDFSQFDMLHAAMDDYLLLGKRRPFHIRTFHGSCLAEAMHIRGTRNRLRMLFLGLTEWLSCSVAHRRVCVSANTRRYIPFAREVIPNGVDLQIFRPGEDKSEHPSILFVGTMGYRKRGQMLLDIFEREILPRVPDAELWIAREPAPVNEKGVSWFGPVPLTELVRLYQRAWVFCLPSSYEGFGVPYIEAMACGTPVVATPNAGACEVLDGGRYGVLTEPEKLGQALLEVLRDADRRNDLAARGLVRAQEFGWDRIVAAYLGPVVRQRSVSTTCTGQEPK